MIHDVTIIGGGVVGCAIARELTRYRLRVILLEKECEVGFGTSKSNSGIIHAGHRAASSTVKGPLEWAGNQQWDQLAADLGFGFKRIGELTVAFDEEQRATLDHLKRQGDQKGVPGLEIWDQERIRRQEPNLTTDIVAALHAPTAGVVNPYEASLALAESARVNGVEIAVENPVLDIAEKDGLLVVKTTRALIHTRFVINAAGLFADRVAAMAGVGDFTVIPRKGEEYLLDKRVEGIVSKLIFPCPTPTSKGILVIPTYDGTLMVGPTAHTIDDKEDLTTSAEGAAEVFREAGRMVPGISERDCISEFAGLRAVIDGEDFIIGPTARKGFINVAGIQSPGLTAAPAIACQVAEILKDQGLALEPNPAFVASIRKPVHFASLPTDEQARLAKADPSHGRIGCRCEHVNEREIIDAIHAGARTLDGIKFRTRAGMGRCQGGFCAWRCMELLSRELSLPITDITKRGAGSWIICEREDGGPS
jgi:glycerol-3-phosphate dehydrogenase